MYSTIGGRIFAVGLGKSLSIDGALVPTLTETLPVILHFLLFGSITS